MPTMVLGEGPVMAFELGRWFLWYLHLRYHQSLTDKEKEVWITDKALTVVLVLRRRRFKLRYFGKFFFFFFCFKHRLIFLEVFIVMKLWLIS